MNESPPWGAEVGRAAFCLLVLPLAVGLVVGDWLGYILLHVAIDSRVQLNRVTRNLIVFLESKAKCCLVSYPLPGYRSRDRKSVV